MENGLFQVPLTLGLEGHRRAAVVSSFWVDTIARSHAPWQLGCLCTKEVGEAGHIIIVHEWSASVPPTRPAHGATICMARVGRRYYVQGGIPHGLAISGLLQAQCPLELVLFPLSCQSVACCGSNSERAGRLDR
jgi:hypothetical protein